MRQPVVSSLYQVNFPVSQAGKLSDIYYTVLNYDGTEYLSKRQDNIVEFDLGFYGVMLAFPSPGSWSIQWEITGYPNPASQEIIIEDKAVIYSMIPG